VLGCLGLALVARKLRRQLKPKLHSE
jgi:hypothetical protein